MDAIVKPYLFRASVVAGLIVLLGLSLSLWVYSSSENVRNNAVILVEERIPTLTTINQLIADLSEQERIIYEYYGDQNSETFLTSFADMKALITMHQHVIAKQEKFKTQYQTIKQGQFKIEALFEKFHLVMQADDIDWDELRLLLGQISNQRRNLLTVLLDVEQQTQATVNRAHNQTLAQMANTHDLVIVFSFSIVLLGLLVAWYSKRYVITNAKNNRLALFMQRNPNPILSINQFGEITYSNQACHELLADIGLASNDLGSLIPDNFLSLREQISLAGITTMTIEQALATRLLQVNINWLKDVDAYDLHIFDVTEQRLSERRISDLAFLNQDSHLPNKYQMDEDINGFIFANTAFVLGMFTIKNFNRTVTTQGFECSQGLVIQLAKLLRENLNPQIKIYQLNDSEFAIIHSDNKGNAHTNISHLVEQINQIINHKISTDHGEFFVELDFGFSLFPEHAETRGDLLKYTRTALTFAEQDEHKQWLLFNEQWTAKLSQNARLLDNLRLALSRNELFLVFQPQLALASKQVVGLETLVRWQHQDKIISPIDFIPLAEQSGLIVPIGDWILRQACAFANQLINKGYPDIVVAVNVSPRQFSHPDFTKSVNDALTDIGLPAKNIELEITEGVFMHNEQDMLAVLHELKEIGVQLSIDDFGTGYSSLSYLKQFPVDKLKIDQSFIRDCHQNEEDRALVSTIVSLGKNLGLSLIAEGVEQIEHVDFLTELNCEEIQGYWYSKPLEKHDLLAFLLASNLDEQ